MKKIAGVLLLCSISIAFFYSLSISPAGELLSSQAIGLPNLTEPTKVDSSFLSDMSLVTRAPKFTPKSRPRAVALKSDVGQLEALVGPTGCARSVTSYETMSDDEADRMIARAVAVLQADDSALAEKIALVAKTHREALPKAAQDKLTTWLQMNEQATRDLLAQQSAAPGDSFLEHAAKDVRTNVVDDLNVTLWRACAARSLKPFGPYAASASGALVNLMSSPDGAESAAETMLSIAAVDSPGLRAIGELIAGRRAKQPGTVHLQLVQLANSELIASDSQKHNRPEERAFKELVKKVAANDPVEQALKMVVSALDAAGREQLLRVSDGHLNNEEAERLRSFLQANPPRTDVATIVFDGP